MNSRFPRLSHEMAARRPMSVAGRLVPSLSRVHRAVVHCRTTATVTCSPTSTAAWRPCSIREATLPGPFALALGGTIQDLRVKVEVHGADSSSASRTVVIFPSFSHSSHVASNADNPAPGWWEDVVGPAKPIDTRHWRVICISIPGSPFSPTQPATPCPATGVPLRAAFPQLTPSDVARAHRAVLEAMGVTEPVHAVVGSSFGGMQALQYASLYPGLVQRLVAISCTGRTTPFTMLVRRMQRRSILADPGYHAGNYASHKTGPWEGLKQAREYGTLFYRSREEYDARFNWSPTGDCHFTRLDTWEAETYVTYQGSKFVHAYDPNAYLLLSKCMDLMDLGDGVAGRATFSDGAARISAKTLLVGVKQDMLIPSTELASLADAINASGERRAEFRELSSVFGHDAFLKESEHIGRLLRAHLEVGLERQLADELVHNTHANSP